jgi:glycosyltransferase involved in cell wall biosynthesis
MSRDEVAPLPAVGEAQPNLTIAIPTYNRGRSLLPRLQALAEQLSDEDELLLLDDGSSDDTAATAAAVPRCRYIRNPANVGMVRNWNLCFKHAQQPWIAVVHDDDSILADGVSTLRKACAVLSVPGVVLHNTSSNPQDRQFRYRVIEPGAAAVLHFPIIPSGAVVHRDVVQAVGGFDERFAFSADLEFFPRACAKFPLLVVENPEVISYNMHESNYQLHTWRDPEFFAQLAAIEDCVIGYADVRGRAERVARRQRMTAYLYHMLRAAERVGDVALIKAVALRLLYQRAIGVRTLVRLVQKIYRHPVSSGRANGGEPLAAQPRP